MSLRLRAFLFFAAIWLALAAPARDAFARDATPQREGVNVGEASSISRLVPAADVENAAKQQYHELLQQAAAKHALAPPSHPQLQRLRKISERLIPEGMQWNPRARTWQWEINLIGSKQVNAFCMPGGKIAVFTGILDKLQLTDDEVAMVVGHEMAHALREHARARIGKSALTQGAARLGGAVIANILGIDPRVTDLVARGGANLLTLKFSRGDETDADLVGMEIAARAGYDPRAAVSLWNKMAAQAGKNAPAEWLSTHPSGQSRIADLQRNIPKVLPLYERAISRK